MPKCNNCKNDNPTPQFNACPDCRAYWRAQAGLKTRRSKYQDLYEQQQVKIHAMKKEIIAFMGTLACAKQENTAEYMAQLVNEANKLIERCELRGGLEVSDTGNIQIRKAA